MRTGLLTQVDFGEGVFPTPYIYNDQGFFVGCAASWTIQHLQDMETCMTSLNPRCQGNLVRKQQAQYIFIQGKYNNYKA